MATTRSNSESEKLMGVDEEVRLFYKGAFDDFDWNKNGRVTCRVRTLEKSKRDKAMYWNTFIANEQSLKQCDDIK